MHNRFDLSGRTALITGASSGLGRHFATTLSKAGARVVLAARRREKLEEILTEIRNQGATAMAASLDVTCAESVKLCLDQIEAEWGTVDLVINNAGVTSTNALLEHSENDWDSVLDTNLKGAWLVGQESARRLKDSGKPGSIVNIASIIGERVAGGVAPYAASKAGLIHLTKCMALELARFHIRVNALAPGYIETDLNKDFLASEAGQNLMKRIPQRRFAGPEELDGPLLLLASEAGSFMTGSVVAADGGHLVSSL